MSLAPFEGLVYEGEFNDLEKDFALITLILPATEG